MNFNHNPLSAGDAPFVLEQQLIRELIANRNTIEKWEARKKVYEQLKNNLAFYAKKMKHRAFAPVGKKAMVKVDLIHTNEITVFIGDSYFVKVSTSDATEICQRRLDECEEMLKKCQAEKQLLESRRDPKIRSEAFGGREIVEKFDETEEEKWRKEHQERVKQHKKRLAEVKEKITESSTKTEEDLFKRLDMLEMQEELEDELARLDDGDEEEEEEYDDDDEEEEEDDEDLAQEEDIVPETPVKKHVRWLEGSSLEPISEIIEPLSPPSEPPKEIVQTTAVKNVITETKPDSAANVTKPSRPASKFKKSRQSAD